MASVQSGRQIREFEHIGEAHPPDAWNLLRKDWLPGVGVRGNRRRRKRAGPKYPLLSHLEGVTCCG
jgi:hypothetical protein